jgi:hypothetical protein
MDAQMIRRLEDGETCLEQIHAIETGCGPKAESALLMDLLRRSPGLEQWLTDPMETKHFPNSLASLNAYKHRLHALRCDYANARLRTIELEEQLAEERLQNLRLEARVKHLDGTLQQIQATKWWKVKECCARWYHWIRGYAYSVLTRPKPLSESKNG